MNCLCLSRRRSCKSDSGAVEFSENPIPRSSNSATHERSSGNISSLPAQRIEREPAAARPHYGLIQLSPTYDNTPEGPTCDIDIIAIHGLNGNPYRTWEAEGKPLWLQYSLPRTLPGARIYTYGYDSKLFTSLSAGDISQYAGRLLEEIDLIRQEPEQQSRPIVFLCHSLGGIVCKKALILANERSWSFDILKSVKGICFFGTPHQGSFWADLGSSASIPSKFFDALLQPLTGSALLRRNLLQDLKTDSRVLSEMSSAFVERVAAVDHIYTFHEGMKMPRLSKLVSWRIHSPQSISQASTVPEQFNNRYSTH